MGDLGCVLQNQQIVPGPFSTGLPRPIVNGVTAVAIYSMVAVVTAAADEKDDGSLGNQQLSAADQQVCDWVFGNGSNVIAVRRLLKALLQYKIDLVDRACGLTDEQKSKLELAGRGEINHLFDRMREIAEKSRLAANDPDTGDALVRDAERLRRGLIEPGSPRHVSLFAKSLEKVLTPGQWARCQPLRTVFWAGGSIQPSGRGRPNDALLVNLAGTAFTDDGLADLSMLSGLCDLSLVATRVTNAGLSHLSGLHALHSLSLDRTRVTDEGLARLKELPNLERLTLDNTRVSDAGLAHLKELTNLKCLSLSGTWVSDAGLAHLKELSGLRELALENTNVNGEGLLHLKNLTGLTDLKLRNTCLSDAGLTHISEFIGLEWLWLEGTQVSDTGLANLSGPASLRWMFTWGTRVTDGKVRDLKRAWPALSIRN